MGKGNTELLFVLVVTGALLVVGLVGVAIFIRQWRKEHGKENNRSNQ